MDLNWSHKGFEDVDVLRKRKSIPGEGTTQRQHVQRHGDIKNSTQVPLWGRNTWPERCRGGQERSRKAKKGCSTGKGRPRKMKTEQARNAATCGITLPF